MRAACTFAAEDFLADGFVAFEADGADAFFTDSFVSFSRGFFVFFFVGFFVGIGFSQITDFRTYAILRQSG